MRLNAEREECKAKGLVETLPGKRLRLPGEEIAEPLRRPGEGQSPDNEDQHQDEERGHQDAGKPLNPLAHFERDNPRGEREEERLIANRKKRVS